ncbi:uncharacterized protein N7469_002014 [Penicillium citrinum]|uniref:Uncharacterized protein n=1 Tax=Penicillium citrinum TaxID=5077 RepID=A0A9W9P9N1_PENCI|nr:uncharacterized protein N7469_002014 [Penicillium citrinum]KAJ5240423.1 hypothetical protein N7469_002014 [Penicillium citrinum]
MEEGDKKLCSVLFSDGGKKHKLSTYEKRPHGDLLGEQSKVFVLCNLMKGAPTDNQENRTYFDSGDLALSAAHKVTNEGVIQTGRAHPDRESISHPFSAVPNTSNVDKDANKDLYRGKSLSPERRSPLYQGANV